MLILSYYEQQFRISPRFLNYFLFRYQVHKDFKFISYLSTKDIIKMHKVTNYLKRESADCFKKSLTKCTRGLFFKF